MKFSIGGDTVVAGKKRLTSVCMGDSILSALPEDKAKRIMGMEESGFNVSAMDVILTAEGNLEQKLFFNIILLLVCPHKGECQGNSQKCI